MTNPRIIPAPVTTLSAICTDPETTPKDTWFIWTKYGHRPNYAHASEAAALVEAERLAKHRPGHSFLVMHCIHKVRVEKVAADLAEAAQQ